MFCPKCGKELRDGSKFCKFCGSQLNVTNTPPVTNKTHLNNSSEQKKKNIIIVTLAVVLIIIAITGVLLVSGVFNDSENNNNNNIIPSVSDSVASGSSGNVKPLEILGGSFSTGTELNDLTYAKIYVGKQHAGEHVYISAVWSRNGNNLNSGTKLSKTVDSNGYVTFDSGSGFKYFPDYVVVKLYYANGDLANTKNVKLSPSSGTQTF